MDAYFNDSGTHKDAQAVTMAGYFASRRSWSKFEKQTKQLFRAEKISFFRATEFYHRKKEFRDWDIAQQMLFATNWFDIAGEHLDCGLASSIDKADFNEAKRKQKYSSSLSSYAYCLTIILSKIRGSTLWPAIDREGLSVFLEAGHAKRDRGVDQSLKEFVTVNDLQANVRPLVTLPKKKVAMHSNLQIIWLIFRGSLQKKLLGIIWANVQSSSILQLREL